MKNVLVALLITTGAVACADNRPAQEPTTTSTTTSASQTTAVTSQGATPSTPSTMTAPAADQTATPLDPNNAAMGTSATAGTTSSMTSSDTSSAPILGTTRSTSANDSSGTASAGTTTKNNGKLTPMDQGGSKGDRDITAAIRRSVVGDSSVSFSGKNVKIITKDGHVTLRGQVKTDAEKSTIDGKARSAAGVIDVDNQLTIKP